MKVLLHSNDKQAAEATDNTIKMLPGGGSLKRGETGEIEFDKEGLATVEAPIMEFLRFSLESQGYVKKVIG